MGLDVYLYKCKDRDSAKSTEELCEKEVESLWDENKKYEEYTEDEKNTIRAKTRVIREKHGLDEHGESKNIEKIEIDSVKYPDHYFKIGYFRSSYNSSGINHILSNLGLMDLHEIFMVRDEYDFKPDWDISRKNVIATIEKFKQCPSYRVSTLNSLITSGDDVPSSQTGVLAIVSEQFKENNGIEDGGWSCRDGEFYPNGIKVFAIVHGTMFGGKVPCEYMVTEGDNEWYVKALEIVLETIDFVLAQDDRDDYYMHWSE